MQGEWDSAKAVGTGVFEERECGLVSYSRQSIVDPGWKELEG